MTRFAVAISLLALAGCVNDRDMLADYCDPSAHCHVQREADAYGSPQQRLDAATRSTGATPRP